MAMPNSLWALVLTMPVLSGFAPPGGTMRSGLQAATGEAAVDAPCGGVLGLDQRPGTSPRSGERLEYELTLGGAYMGKLELSVGAPRQMNGAPAIPLFGRLRTNAFISAVRAVEGRYQAMVDPTTLAPVGVRVEVKVGDDPRWERVRFEKGGRRVETHFRLHGREARRAFEAKHTLLEALSLLHVARRVSLEPGLRACQDLLSTRRMWRVRAEVVGKETVETPVGPKPAYRVRTIFTRQAYPHRRTKPRQVRIDVLLGDMPGRPPLSFEMSQSKSKGRANLIRWKRGRAG